jgi:hypothetical protein
MPFVRPEDLPVSVPEDQRSEGRRLFETGQVRLMEGSRSDVFEARVTFFRRYHTVWVERGADGAVDYACSCPTRENVGTPAPGALPQAGTWRSGGHLPR